MTTEDRRTVDRVSSQPRRLRPTLIARTLTAAVFAVFLGAARSPSAAAQASPSRQAFRSGVELVRVDAVVTDRRGEFIRDLTPADFEISEAGKKQGITSFVLVDGSRQSAVDESAPPARAVFDCL